MSRCGACLRYIKGARADRKAHAERCLEVDIERHKSDILVIDGIRALLFCEVDHSAPAWRSAGLNLSKLLMLYGTYEVFYKRPLNWRARNFVSCENDARLRCSFVGDQHNPKRDDR